MGPEQNWPRIREREREMATSQSSSGSGSILPPPASAWGRMTQARMSRMGQQHLGRCFCNANSCRDIPLGRVFPAREPSAGDPIFHRFPFAE